MLEIGQQIKNWTIIGKAPDRYSGSIRYKRYFYWICKCNICDKNYEIEQSRLQNEKANFMCKACAMKSKNFKDYTNQKFYFITLIKRINNTSIWECKCDCGNTFECKGSLVPSGHKRSCGKCGLVWTDGKYWDRKKKYDLLEIGTKYNNYTIIKILDYPFYECKCDCGNIRKVRIYDLVNNKATNCGCLQNKNAAIRIHNTLLKISNRYHFNISSVNQVDRLYLLPDSAKKIIRIRDSNTCILCDNVSDLCIHHIQQYRYAKHLLVDSKNLCLLCYSCHKKIHNNNFHGPTDPLLTERAISIIIHNENKLPEIYKRKYIRIINTAREKYEHRKSSISTRQ